jgi:helix-turn-helix protein
MNRDVSTNSSTVVRPDRIKRERELPALRFDIDEAKDILRMSRAQLYIRIAEGAIAIQKDGARTYISLRELERYVEACEHHSQS